VQVKKFKERAENITATVNLITGFVAAVAAAFAAFSETMATHYKGATKHLE
jgi:hypothetical protein